MLPSFLRKRYAFNHVWYLLLSAWFLVWPVSALAGTATVKTLNSLGLQAPFLMSWSTIWFFAVGGGILSNFVKLDIDRELRAVYIAKPLMGILLSVAIIMWLNGEADPPDPSYGLAALGTSFTGAPLMQGALVYITKENFLTNFFDRLAKKFIGK